MWQDTETWRQSLLLALLLTPLNVEVNVIRIAPLLLEVPALLPEATLINALAIRQFLREIGVHIATDFFNLDNGALKRFFLGQGQRLHSSQQGDNVFNP